MPKGIQALPTNDTQLANCQESLAPSDKKDSSKVASPTSGAETGTKTEQAATTPAEGDLTTATVSQAPDQQPEGNARPLDIPPANSDKTALAPPNNADRLIAILLVRPEIKSASDLADKVVAIDASRSRSIADVKGAIAGAGGSEVQISEGETLALIRVMDGEVPAGVVDLLSPQAAEAWNAGAKGFNILRIPLASPSGKG